MHALEVVFTLEVLNLEAIVVLLNLKVSKIIMHLKIIKINLTFLILAIKILEVILAKNIIIPEGVLYLYLFSIMAPLFMGSSTLLYLDLFY